MASGRDGRRDSPGERKIVEIEGQSIGIFRVGDGSSRYLMCAPMSSHLSAWDVSAAQR